jgi:SAM-dependent methyltransferase
MKTNESDYVAVNKALWNSKVPHHLDSDFYRTEEIVNGADALVGPEKELLGDLNGKRVLHLQCHFGLDSIHLARMGAQVTGLDLSDQAIAEAKKISQKAQLDIRFICDDVYNTLHHVGREFDLVFSSYGTIGWLPDLNKWASIVSAVLKKGGRLLLAEFHPVLWMFDSKFTHFQYSYFNNKEISEAQEGTYADKDADINLPEISWNHPLSDVITSLISQGMTISRFEEYDYSPYDCFDTGVKVAEHRYQLKELKEKLPMMYILEAKKQV